MSAGDRDSWIEGPAVLDRRAFVVRRRVVAWTIAFLVVVVLLLTRTMHAAVTASAYELGVLRVVAIAVLVLAWRALDAALALPLSADAKVAGFALAAPGLWIAPLDASGSVTIFVLVLLLAAAGNSRAGRPFRAGAAAAIAAFVVPGAAFVAVWWAVRRTLRPLIGFLNLLAILLAALRIAHGPGVLDDPWPGGFLGAATPSAPSWAAFGVAALAMGIAVVAGWWRRPGPGLDIGGPELAATALAAWIAGGGTAGLDVLWLPAGVVGYEAWQRASASRARLGGAVLWGAAFALSLTRLAPGLGRDVPAAAVGLLLVLAIWPGFYPERRR